MKHTWIALFFTFPIFLQAQSENIFHDRSFWSTQPNVDVIRQKIAEGHDAEALDPNAFDAVTSAINSGAPLETIKFLLSLEGNDVNKHTHDGRNYLMWAGRSGNIEIVKILLEKGSRTDITDSHGYNFLTFTAASGNTDIELYDLILDHEVSVHSTTRSGANVLHILAASIKDKNMIDYFVEKGLDIHSRDDEGNGMFNYAAKGGNIELMEHLIKMGLDYKKLNSKGENALFFATQGSRGYTNPLSVYKFLEGLGFEVDIVNFEGQTPIHNLSRSARDMEIINYFIDNGVNINQVDRNGNTAFMNAVSAGNTVVAESLLPEVKEINLQNKEGYSALSYAIMRSSGELVDLLKVHGADFSILDANGNNLVYHLFNSYSNRTKDGFDPLFELLKEKGLGLAESFENGNTLAHIAIEKEEKGLLLKAIDSNVEINQKNDDGLTPLHLAAMKAKNNEILNILLDSGADKSILTEFEESAFDLASENEALKKAKLDLKFLKIN